MKRLKRFLFLNSSPKQTIVKNTFWLFFGEIIGRVLKLGVIILATRMLGTEGWGTFSYALAFVSFFYMFSDIGINIFITRELSKDNVDRYAFISAAFVLKLILLTLSFIVSLLFIPYVGAQILSMKIILAIAVLNFSDSLREFALSINRALLKMEREAFIKILLSVLIAVFGVTLLFLDTTPLSLAIAYAVGSSIASIITLWMLRSLIPHVTWKCTLSQIKTIFNFSWPFIALTLFSTAIVTIDSIMLANMKSTHEVGLYAAAQRIIQFMAIIPLFIGISLFPIMTKHENNTETFRNLFEKAMTLIFTLALPITLTGLLLGSDIMSTVFGVDFIQGGYVLAILMIVILADFPYIMINNVISIKGIQRKFILSAVVGLLVNIIINFSLIPSYGARGAALSTAIAQLLIMGINWNILKKEFYFSVLPKLSKVVLASVGMSISILICVSIGSPLIITLILAGTVYVFLLHITKEPALLEIISLIRR